MAKNTVLITSLVALAVWALHSFSPFTGSLVLLVVSWIAVPFVVFSDAKERGRKHGPWGGACFLLGWIGGLIYYFTIKK